MRVTQLHFACDWHICEYSGGHRLAKTKLMWEAKAHMKVLVILPFFDVYTLFFES